MLLQRVDDVLWLTDGDATRPTFSELLVGFYTRNPPVPLPLRYSVATLIQSCSSESTRWSSPSPPSDTQQWSQPQNIQQRPRVQDGLHAEATDGEALEDSRAEVNTLRKTVKSVRKSLRRFRGVQKQLKEVREELERFQRALEQCEDTLVVTQAALATSESSLASTRDSLKTSESALVTTREAYESSERSLKTTKNELEASQQSLANSQASLRDSESSLATTQKALKTSDRSRIVSQMELRPTIALLGSSREMLKRNVWSLKSTRIELSSTRRERNRLAHELDCVRSSLWDAEEHILDALVEQAARIETERTLNRQLKQVSRQLGATTVELNLVRRACIAVCVRRDELAEERDSLLAEKHRLSCATMCLADLIVSVKQENLRLAVGKRVLRIDINMLEARLAEIQPQLRDARLDLEYTQLQLQHTRMDLAYERDALDAMKRDDRIKDDVIERLRSAYERHLATSWVSHEREAQDQQMEVEVVRGQAMELERIVADLRDQVELSARTIRSHVKMIGEQHVRIEATGYKLECQIDAQAAKQEGWDTAAAEWECMLYETNKRVEELEEAEREASMQRRNDADEQQRRVQQMQQEMSMNNQRLVTTEALIDRIQSSTVRIVGLEQQVAMQKASLVNGARQVRALDMESKAMRQQDERLQQSHPFVTDGSAGVMAARLSMALTAGDKSQLIRVGRGLRSSTLAQRSTHEPACVARPGRGPDMAQSGSVRTQGSRVAASAESQVGRNVATRYGRGGRQASAGGFVETRRRVRVGCVGAMVDRLVTIAIPRVEASKALHAMVFEMYRRYNCL